MFDFIDFDFGEDVEPNDEGVDWCSLFDSLEEAGMLEWANELELSREEKNMFPFLSQEESDEMCGNIVDSEFEVILRARKEYAPGQNIFANFNRVAERLGVSPQVVCLTYALKHMDGITHWVNGNHKQRDSIEGRITDLRNYLLILEQMIICEREGRMVEIVS